MSQLLSRIDQALSTERDAIRRAELLARRAGYLARVGRFSEAKQIVADLRVAFGDGRSGRTTIWIMVAEGMIGLFESLSIDAFDRIARAQLLSRAMADRELLSIASAWKAHYEFETSNYRAMMSSLAIARESTDDSNLDARTRLAMVLCNAYSICGDKVNAEKWFSTCRDGAVSAGDQASIDALLYNRAAFGVSRLRVRSCVTGVIEGDLTFSRRDVSNALNFQVLTRTAALTNFVHLSDARLLMLERKYSLAIERLNAVRGLSPFANYNFSEALVDLEIAYCHFMENRQDGAIANLRGLSMSDFHSLDLDERLVAAKMLLEMSREGIGQERTAEYEIVFKGLSLEYEAAMSQLHSELIALTGGWTH